MKLVYIIGVGGVGNEVVDRLKGAFDWESEHDYIFNFKSLDRFHHEFVADDNILIYLIMGSDVIDFRDVYNLIKSIKLKHSDTPIGIFLISEYYKAYKNNYLIREISKVVPIFFIINEKESQKNDSLFPNIERAVKAIKYAIILDTIIYDIYNHINISVESPLALRSAYYTKRYNIIKMFSFNSPELITDPMFWGKKIITATNKKDNNVKEITLHILVNNKFTEHFTLDYIGDLITEIFNQSCLNRLTWNVTFHENMEDGIVIEAVYS